VRRTQSIMEQPLASPTCEHVLDFENRICYLEIAFVTF
jgi:hypothetical protein